VNMETCKNTVLDVRERSMRNKAACVHVTQDILHPTILKLIENCQIVHVFCSADNDSPYGVYSSYAVFSHARNATICDLQSFRTSRSGAYLLGLLRSIHGGRGAKVIHHATSHGCCAHVAHHANYAQQESRSMREKRSMLQHFSSMRRLFRAR
jgi:hypothetical protein